MRNRQPRRHRNLTWLVSLPALVLAFAVAIGLGTPTEALAHGHGGGGPAAVTGPSAMISAPATAFYGGFAQPVHDPQPNQVHRVEPSQVQRAAYFQSQPTPPVPATEEARPSAPNANASGNSETTTAPAAQPLAQPVVGDPIYGGPMGDWGGSWYLAPPGCGGYVSPGSVISAPRMHPHPHPWAPIRFYRSQSPF